MAGIPKGFHTITPQIHVSNGDKAITLYKKALGAKELHRMLAPGTKSITLPDDGDLRIMAMTVSDEGAPVEPAQPLYDTLP